MHMYFRVIKDSDFIFETQSEIIITLARESKGPLPSCFLLALILRSSEMHPRSLTNWQNALSPSLEFLRDKAR